MAELKWKTPVPQKLDQVLQWLKEQEQSADYELEASFILGGAAVAERLLGFEGLHTGYTAPDVLTILTAPAAGKKRIIIGLSIQVDAAAVFQLVIRKVAVDTIIAEIIATTSKEENDVIGSLGGPKTLDDINESLIIKTVSGSGVISYSGSYLDVD